MKEPLVSKSWPPLTRRHKHGFRLRPLSPDSSVIGITYDGTTAGKKRLVPRKCLDRAIRGPVHIDRLAVCSARCGYRTGGGEPHSPALPSMASIRSPISPMASLSLAGRNSRFPRPARSGAFITRAIGPPLSPIRKSTGRSSAATTRSMSPVASPVAGNPYFWLVSEQRLYLFSREQARDAFAADAANILRRCEPALAGGSEHPGAVGR